MCLSATTAPPIIIGKLQKKVKSLLKVVCVVGEQKKPDLLLEREVMTEEERLEKQFLRGLGCAFALLSIAF